MPDHLPHTIQQAALFAKSRRHKCVTREHLLLALIESESAKKILLECEVNVERLQHRLNQYLDHETPDLILTKDSNGNWWKNFVRKLREFKGWIKPSRVSKERLAYDAVLRHAEQQMKISAQDEVMPSNVLMALMADSDSKCYFFLKQEGMTRAKLAGYMASREGQLFAQEEMRITEIARTYPAETCHVRILNDDKTPMDLVVHALEKFFAMDRQKAARTMLEVHRKGAASCGVFPCAEALLKVNMVTDYARQNGHSLQCTMEKE